MPIIAASIIGGASLLGSAYSARSSRKAAQGATDQNITAMQNRHTWEVEDLKRAGLNPILSAHSSGTQGLPAVMPQIPDFGLSLAQGVNTGLSLAKTPSEIELKQTQAQVAKNVQNIGDKIIDALDRFVIPGANTIDEVINNAAFWEQAGGTLARGVKGGIEMVKSWMKAAFDTYDQFKQFVQSQRYKKREPMRIEINQGNPNSPYYK